MNKLKGVLLFVLALVLSGCASWQLIESKQEWKKDKIQAVLPDGWMKCGYGNDVLFLTKDGELLQYIRITTFKVNDEKELPLSKKKFTDEMLPQEIADVILNEINLDKNNQNFKIIENNPVDICSHKGFKAIYSYNTPDNLKTKSIIYGFKEGKLVYLVQYLAAQQYYFDKDAVVFNTFVQDLKMP